MYEQSMETAPAPAAEVAPADAVVEQQATAEPPAEPERPEWERRLDALLEEQGASEEAGEVEAGGDAATPAGGDEAAGAADEGGAPPTEPTAETEEAPILSLPGRREDEPDFELRMTQAVRQALEAEGVDPDQFVERTAQLRNGAMRRREYEEARQDLQAGYEELTYIEQELAERPADFLADRVSAEHYRDITRRLLLRMSDADFDTLIDELAKWDRDPSEKRLAMAAEREAVVDRRDQAKRGEEQRRAGRDYAQQLAGAIGALVPDVMPDEQASEFFDFAIYKLEQWARTQPKGTRVAPEQVPALLGELGVLAPYGLAQSGEAKPGSSRDSTPKSGRPEGPADDLEKRAEQTGKQLQERAERRKNAVVTPAGVGAGAAPLAPPRGQTFEERMSWLESRFGLKKP